MAAGSRKAGSPHQFSGDVIAQLSGAGDLGSFLNHGFRGLQGLTNYQLPIWMGDNPQKSPGS